MAVETVQTYKVKIKFDESFKKLQRMQEGVRRFNAAQAASTRRRTAALRDMDSHVDAHVKNEQRLAAETAKADRQRAKSAEAAAQRIAAARGRTARPAEGADSHVEAHRRNQEALRREIALIERSNFMIRQGANDQQMLARQAIRENIARATSVQQLRQSNALTRESFQHGQRRIRQMERQSFLMSRMNTSARQFAGSMVSAFAVAAGGRAIIRIGQDLESAAIAMEAATGSAEEGAIQMKFARQEAKRLGLDIVNTSKDYSKLFAAGRGKVATEQIQEIFLGVSEASAVMGLSSDDAAGSLRA